MSEVGRVLKFAGPNTSMRGPRGIFVSNVIQRVFPEGNCLALLNHPPADIYAVGSEYGTLNRVQSEPDQIFFDFRQPIIRLGHAFREFDGGDQIPAKPLEGRYPLSTGAKPPALAVSIDENTIFQAATFDRLREFGDKGFINRPMRAGQFVSDLSYRDFQFPEFGFGHGLTANSTSAAKARSHLSSAALTWSSSSSSALSRPWSR